MDTLGAVNLILRKIGETPIPSLDEPYPTLSIALPNLDEGRITILSEGYWFNQYYDFVLNPQPDGTVPTPLGTLKFFPDDGKYTWDGTRIRNSADGTINIGTTVQGRLITDRIFEELPESAQYAIAYWAAAATYRADIGPDDEWKSLQAQTQMYTEQINGDHTISRKQNSRKRKQPSRWYAALRS